MTMEIIDQLEQIICDQIDHSNRVYGKENSKSVTLQWVLEEITKLKSEV